MAAVSGCVEPRYDNGCTNQPCGRSCTCRDRSLQTVREDRLSIERYETSASLPGGTRCIDLALSPRATRSGGMQSTCFQARLPAPHGVSGSWACEMPALHCAGASPAPPRKRRPCGTRRNSTFASLPRSSLKCHGNPHSRSFSVVSGRSDSCSWESRNDTLCNPACKLLWI